MLSFWSFAVSKRLIRNGFCLSQQAWTQEIVGSNKTSVRRKETNATFLLIFLHGLVVVVVYNACTGTGPFLACRLYFIPDIRAEMFYACTRDLSLSSDSQVKCVMVSVRPVL